jgi:hypothetical protein
MARATHDDVSVFSVDASSLLADQIDASITFDHETFDSSVVGDTNDVQCAVKKFAVVEGNFRSTNANCTVSGLDLSAITIDSVDMLAYLQGMNFQGTNVFKDVDGVSDEWKSRQFVKQILTASGQFLINTNAATEDGLILDAASSTLSNLNMVVAFTINSVAFSIPFMIKSAKHMWTRGDIQMWDFAFVQRGAITSPAGTATMLTKAINAPGVAQALIIESKAAGGINYDGDFFVESFGFTVNKQDAIITNYRWISEGAIVPTATV